jgi:hypothetical protein
MEDDMSMKTYRVGSRVRRSAFGKNGGTGVVTKVTPVNHRAGGVTIRLRVRWDGSGAESSVDDRQVKPWYSSQREAREAIHKLDLRQKRADWAAKHHARKADRPTFAKQARDMLREIHEMEHLLPTLPE